MSYYHFTTNLEHKRRVIQLGENPERVFDCGAISIESIMNIDSKRFVINTYIKGCIGDVLKDDPISS